MRQPRFPALPADENSIKCGEQPRLNLAVVADLAAFGQQPRKGFLGQLAGVIPISSQAEGESVPPLVKRGDDLLIIQFLHVSMKNLKTGLFRENLETNCIIFLMRHTDWGSPWLQQTPSSFTNPRDHLMPADRNRHESGDSCTISLTLDCSPGCVKVAHFEI